MSSWQPPHSHSAQVTPQWMHRDTVHGSAQTFKQHLHGPVAVAESRPCLISFRSCLVWVRVFGVGWNPRWVLDFSNKQIGNKQYLIQSKSKSGVHASALVSSRKLPRNTESAHSFISSLQDFDQVVHMVCPCAEAFCLLLPLSTGLDHWGYDLMTLNGQCLSFKKQLIYWGFYCLRFVNKVTRILDIKILLVLVFLRVVFWSPLNNFL